MHLDDFRVFYMDFVLHFWWIFVFGWYDMCSCTQEMFSSVSTSMFTLFGTVSSWSLMKFVPLFEETLAISEPVWTDLNVQEDNVIQQRYFFVCLILLPFTLEKLLVFTCILWICAQYATQMWKDLEGLHPFAPLLFRHNAAFFPGKIK